MEEQLKRNFNNLIDNLPETDVGKESIKARKIYLKEFIKKGFPNKRIEDWKFSDLNQIISSNVEEIKFFNYDQTQTKFDQLKIIKNFKHNKIIFANGLVSKIDFSYEEKAKIEVLNNLTEENTKKIGRLRSIHPEFTYSDENPLISLNNGLKFSHVKLNVKKNYKFKKPLIIYNFTNQEINSTVVNLRFDLRLQEKSALKIINLFNDDSDNSIVNINHQYRIGKGAILKNYKIDHKENSNIKYFYNNIDLDDDSVSENFVFSKGSKFIKHEINCDLRGEYSSAFVNGIINLKNSQHHEIKTNINHLRRDTKSYQLIKSVLDENSKGVYQGKIFVNQHAQKTDGYQLSRTLLLNENTEFDAKPELEIYADDVKCSHGSTSGNLDENSIFYLMSRGLNYQQSRELLINGFLLDIIEKITDLEIKDLIKNIIKIKE